MKAATEKVARAQYEIQCRNGMNKKVKVKVTLVQALTLCTDRTAHRGSRGIALLFHDQQH